MNGTLDTTKTKQANLKCMTLDPWILIGKSTTVHRRAHSQYWLNRLKIVDAWLIADGSRAAGCSHGQIGLVEAQVANRD